jgi:hypothetical protein
MRRLLIPLIGLLLISSVSAQIEPEIKKECSSTEEPVISISDPGRLYSHAAEPGYYDDQLCVDGISESSIQETECRSSVGFYLTSREDNAHYSTFGDYRLNVCTGEMSTRLTSKLESCRENETELFSVSGEENAHVAEPGVFDRLVCGSYIEPDNVSVTLEYNLTSDDEVYFDGEKMEGEQEFKSADYPAFVSEGDQMVSGLILSEMSSGSRKIDGANQVRLNTNFSSASYIIPFTKGDLGEIERREETVTDGSFLNQISPSFAYLIPETPVVRVIYSPELDLDSNISYNPGAHEFDIIKNDENSIGIY